MLKTCSKWRTLTHKGVKFEWDEGHDAEYKRLMANFGNLELLEPYDSMRELCALTDTSYLGLAFILFKKGQIVIGVFCRWEVPLSRVPRKNGTQ